MEARDKGAFIIYGQRGVGWGSIGEKYPPPLKNTWE